MVSYHLPQFPLIFVIGIAGNADQFDALGIGEGPAEIPAVFFDLLLAGGRFFYVQFAARLLPDLPAVQPAVISPSRVRWCRSSTSFCAWAKARQICSAARSAV